MLNKWIAQCLFSISVFALGLTYAQTAYSQTPLKHSFASAPNEVINTHIVDQHKFYGLASYYNSVRFIKVGNDNNLKNIKSDENLTLENNEWLVIVGRFNVLTIQTKGLNFSVENDKISLKNPEVLEMGRVNILQKHELKSHAPELDKIRYSHLFFAINWLARALEAVLIFIHSLVGNWGLSIILISIFLKLVMLPLARLVRLYQQDVSKTQTKLAPRLAEIKTKYKGEEAHKHFMTAHKEAGVTTFYTLKPMIGLIVQIPVWIAIFNVLAEMPQITGHGFLWIKDLAYPDAIAYWPTPIPLLGDTLNLLPLIMTTVTIASTIGFQDNFSQAEILKKQKRNLLFMAAAFLILFFPFPSGMVLYWTLANVLNAIQQVLGRRKKN